MCGKKAMPLALDTRHLSRAVGGIAGSIANLRQNCGVFVKIAPGDVSSFVLPLSCEGDKAGGAGLSGPARRNGVRGCMLMGRRSLES
jgi:hypothetical protein